MAVWQRLDREYLWQSPWYNLRQDRLRTAEGHEFTYTIVDHPGAVWIVPVTRQGQVVLIRSYRYPVDDWCYEVPAGGLSPGLTPEEVARRELLEEVGGTAYVYFASGVELGEAQPEPTELMEIRLVPVGEALRMAHEGEITDGPSALALLWCEPLIQR